MDLEVEPDAVVVVAGIPGAGKTTLIDRAVDPAFTLVVDIERRRREGRVPQRNAVRIAGHYRRILTAVMLHGDRVVVVHSRGTTASARVLVAVLARLRRRPAHLVLLMAPADEAIDGQLRRGRTIPTAEMEVHAERFAGLVADHGSVARREGWASVTVLDRSAAGEVGRIGPPRSSTSTGGARPAQAMAGALAPAGLGSVGDTRPHGGRVSRLRRWARLRGW